MKGLFVSLEGAEGSGKSTQIELLREHYENNAIFIREPGGTVLSEEVRTILLNSNHSIDPYAEMYLFFVARAQILSNVIEPALKAGKLVVADRYHDSTLAYQGGGRGLEVPWPSNFRKPDQTFLIDIPLEVSIQRRALQGRIADRIERESDEFHSRIAQTYRELAAQEAHRFCLIDGILPPNKIFVQIISKLTELGHPPLRALDGMER